MVIIICPDGKHILSDEAAEIVESEAKRLGVMTADLVAVIIEQAVFGSGLAVEVRPAGGRVNVATRQGQ